MLGGWVNPHREQQTIPQGQISKPAQIFPHAGLTQSIYSDILLIISVVLVHAKHEAARPLACVCVQ